MLTELLHQKAQKHIPGGEVEGALEQSKQEVNCDDGQRNSEKSKNGWFVVLPFVADQCLRVDG